jgi:hypothetical protein
MRNGNGSGTHEPGAIAAPDGDGELTAAMPDGDGEQARKASTDLIAALLAERDALARKAAEARARLERLQLDEDAIARRRRGEVLLQ